MHRLQKQTRNDADAGARDWKMAAWAAFLIGAFGLVGCESGGGNDGPPTYLKGLGIDIERYDPSTGRAGAIVFNERDNKPFAEFGPKVLLDQSGVWKDNCAFEFHVAPDAVVRAAADGTVIYFQYQPETTDYEIGIEASDGRFVADYDHIRDPAVQMGSTVVAGDVLGHPGPWDEFKGRTEFQVNVRGDDGTVLAYAPWKFFDPALVQQYQDKISNLMNDWENFKGDPSIYDQARQISPGCLSETVVP